MNVNMLAMQILSEGKAVKEELLHAIENHQPDENNTQNSMLTTAQQVTISKLKS